MTDFTDLIGQVLAAILAGIIALLGAGDDRTELEAELRTLPSAATSTVHDLTDCQPANEYWQERGFEWSC